MPPPSDPGSVLWAPLVELRQKEVIGQFPVRGNAALGVNTGLKRGVEARTSRQSGCRPLTAGLMWRCRFTGNSIRVNMFHTNGEHACLPMAEWVWPPVFPAQWQSKHSQSSLLTSDIKCQHQHIKSKTLGLPGHLKHNKLKHLHGRCRRHLPRAEQGP